MGQVGGRVEAGGNWDIFRVFLAVAREGSISGAARVLDASQPTVSRRIRELESRLGSRLVERTVGGVRLTPAGRNVMARVERIEVETRAMTDGIGADDAAPRGRLVIAAPEGIGRAVLPPVMTAFAKRFPEIEVELLLGARKVNLLNRDADIAIRIGDPGQSTLVGRRIGDVPFGLYAARGLVADLGRAPRLADLDGLPLVDGGGPMARSAQSRALARLAPAAPRVFRSDAVSIQADAAEWGLGVAALPRYVGEARADLVEILPGALDVSLGLWLLSDAETRRIERVRVGLRFLGAALDARFGAGREAAVAA